MKLLVTGAAGCIGSTLAEKLLQRGDEVVGLDNFDPYYSTAQKRANQRRLEGYPNFRLVEADVRDRERLLTLVHREKFGAIAHLAALAGVRNSVANPALYVEVDYNGTQHLMDAARATGVGNFVFASTSSVYGDTKQIPFVETDPCDRPVQPYAAAKRAAEMLGYTYYRLYGLNFTVVRFFTVYGPYNRPDMMAFLVADSVTQGRQIPLYNGGRMYRDWTYVGDIAEGVVAALDRPLGYEIFNLGRGEPVLLKDFIGIVEELAGRRANLLDQPKPASDMEQTYADISKARAMLGYDPKVSVREGVAAFWNWYATRQP